MMTRKKGEGMVGVVICHDASSLDIEDIWLGTNEIKAEGPIYITGNFRLRLVDEIKASWQGEMPEILRIPKFASCVDVAQSVAFLSIVAGASARLYELSAGNSEIKDISIYELDSTCSSVAWRKAQECAERSNWTDFTDRLSIHDKNRAGLITAANSYLCFIDPKFRVDSNNPSALALFETKYEEKLKAALRREAARHIYNGKSPYGISSFIKILEAIENARIAWRNQRSRNDLASVLFFTAKMLIEKSISEECGRDAVALLRFRAMELFLNAIAILFNIVEAGRGVLIMDNKPPSLSLLAYEIGERLRCDATVFDRVIKTRNRAIEGHGFNAWPEKSFEYLDHACAEAKRLCCLKSSYINQLDGLRLPHECGTDLSSMFSKIFAKTTLREIAS